MSHPVAIPINFKSTSITIIQRKLSTRLIYMKSVMKAIVVMVTLAMISSCDQLYEHESFISFADMDAKELLEEIDGALIENCSDEEYTSILKITKEECSNSITSRKEVCLNNVMER